MANDGREVFLMEAQADFVSRFGADTAKEIVDILITRLNSWNIEHKQNEIAVIDPDNEQYLSFYLATKKIEGRSDKTLERYAYIIRRIHKETGVGVKRMTTMHLRAYLAKLQTGGMSVNSISGVRNVITAYFGWLHREGLLPNNPSAQLGAVKMERKIEDAFATVDIDRLREACDNDRDRAILEFLRSTGCRVAEVARLNVSDLNINMMEVKVHGKGNKERIVYFDDVCAMRIKKYLNNRETNSTALFAGIGKRSNRLTCDGIRVLLKRLESKAGVVNVHPHRFRRTLATDLAKYGMPVQHVGRVLGHANINTTMKYVSVDDALIKGEYRRYM